MTFKQLHEQHEPLLICNVWDVASASLAEQKGFQAAGTSSAAIAGLLGYQDGEKMSFSELEFMVQRIIANTNIPLTVDIEAGYSRKSSEVFNNILRLTDLGVVGINLEDSIVGKERSLSDMNDFAETLGIIKKELLKKGTDLFLNARIDTFLLNYSNKIEETLKRVHLYEEAGADGIFVPCIEKEEDIREITAACNLPINVMCMPNLPDFERLKEIGVKRISMGNFLFEKMYGHFQQMLDSVKQQEKFNAIF